MAVNLKALPHPDNYEDKEEFMRELVLALQDNLDQMSSELADLDQRVTVLEP